MKSKLWLLTIMFLFSLNLILFDSEKANAQPRARFEVSLFRFHVNRQSLENAVEFNGAGDEVSFSRVAILHNRRTGSRALSDGINLTPSFGEQPPNTFRAGHASPSHGGLKTGDDVLVPPIILFSDELIQGESAATIIASIWELDGPTELRRNYENFLFNFQPDMERVALATLRNAPATASLVHDWDNSFTSNSPVGTPNTTTVVTLGDGFLGLGEAKDRPIGMVRQGNSYNFIPKLLILNFDNASRAAETNQGSGLGVIKITYTDDQKLAGDYTLFIKIRRL